MSRPYTHLYVCLIANCGQGTRRLMKSFRHIIKHIRLQSAPESTQIIRPQHAPILIYFVKVRIYLKLTRLMPHNGHGALASGLRKRHSRVRICAIYYASIRCISIRKARPNMCVIFSCLLTAHATSDHEIFALQRPIPTKEIIRTKRIKSAAVMRTQLIHPIVHGRRIAPQLIAQCHHHKARMIAKSSDYCASLFSQKVVQFLAVLAHAVGLYTSPKWQFGL